MASSCTDPGTTSPPGAIRRSDPAAGQKLSHYVHLAQLAERGLFDFVFNADTQATFGPDEVDVWKRTTVAHRIEPITLLGALAAVTQHIGLVATATTTYLEPFHVARMFASLDQLSEGRTGWNVVTSSAPAEALNFSHAAHAPHGERYERAAEFVQVVLGLWDTWEDDAFVLDKAEGLFFDPEKLHMLNHKGKHFSVRGPLMIQRSPQGRPLIVHAGQSEAGRSLAAQAADVVFSVEQDIDKAREFYADMKSRAAKHGRPPDSIKIMPGVLAVIGRSKAEAEDKYDRIQSLIHPELGVAYLSEMVAMDLSRISARRADAGRAADQLAAGPAEGHCRDGAARGPDDPAALPEGGGHAGAPRGLRHRQRHRGFARALVQERRRRRLQHPDADAA